MHIKRYLLALVASIFALVGTVDAQTTEPLKYVTTQPGGSCPFTAVPQFVYPAGTYWACRGTFSGNPSNWINGTWTQVTPPTTVVAGDGKGGFLTATAAQVNALATNPAFAAPVTVANGGTGSNTLSGVVTQSVVIPLTLTQLQTLNTVGVAVLPTPAATTMYMMGPCTLNLTYGSAAFTSGGTVTIGYGATAATTASNSTIAATVFTSFSASHLVTVEPTAQSVGATTLYAGLGVWMNAATGNFVSGTGATGQLSCQYSVITGVS